MSQGGEIVRTSGRLLSDDVIPTAGSLNGLDVPADYDAKVEIVWPTSRSGPLSSCGAVLARYRALHGSEATFRWRYAGGRCDCDAHAMATR